MNRTESAKLPVRKSGAVHLVNNFKSQNLQESVMSLENFYRLPPPTPNRTKGYIHYMKSILKFPEHSSSHSLPVVAVTNF